MATADAQQLRRPGAGSGKAGDAVDALPGNLAGAHLDALSLYLEHLRQPWPRQVVIEHRAGGQLTHLYPPVTFVDLLGAPKINRYRAEARPHRGGGEQPLNGLTHARLIVLHHPQIIAAGQEDVLRKRHLRLHRIACHHPTLQVDHLHHARGDENLILVALNRHLHQHHPLTRQVGGQQMAALSLGHPPVAA
jgi:hypothetical protein